MPMSRKPRPWPISPRFVARQNLAASGSRQRSHEKTKAAGSGFRPMTQAPDRLSVRRDALERRTGVGIRHPAAAVRHNALPHRSGVGVVPARVSPPRLHVHVTLRLHGAVRCRPVCRRGLRPGDGAGAEQEAGNDCRQDFPVHFHSPLLVIVEQQMFRCGSSPKATNSLMLRSGRFVGRCYVSLNAAMKPNEACGGLRLQEVKDVAASIEISRGLLRLLRSTAEDFQQTLITMQIGFAGCLKIDGRDQVAIPAMHRGKAAVAAWTRRPVVPHVHAARGVIARVGSIAVKLAGISRRDRRGARAASRDHRGCRKHNSKRPKSKRPKSKRHHQKRFPATLAAALHLPESSPAYLQVD
jgi:hypothetical protein